MDVYKIAIGLHLTGNVDREIKGILREMQTLERRVDAIGKSLKNWITPLQAISSQISATNKGVKQVADSFGKWGTPLRAVGAQIGQIEKSIGGLSKAGGGLNNWGQAFETRMATVARTVETQAQRMQAAINRVHGAAPSVTGPGPLGPLPAGRGAGSRGAGVRQELAPLRRGMVPLGQYGTGIGAFGGVGSIATIGVEGAKSVREDILQRGAGINPKDMAALKADAGKYSKQFPSLTETEIREMGRLLIPNTGNYETMSKVLPSYLRTLVGLQTTLGPDKAAGHMENMARFIDNIGRSTDVGATDKLLEGYYRSVQLDSEALKSVDFLLAAKRGSTAAKSLSVDTWADLMPLMFMQQGGNATGTGLMSAYQNTTMGRATDEAIGAQFRLGMREGTEWEVGKSGKKKLINKGSMTQENLQTTRPYIWTKEVLLPELIKRGAMPEAYGRGDFSEALTEEQRNSMNKLVNSAFSNRTGANIYSTFLGDMAQFEMLHKRRQQTTGLGDIEKDQFKDPFVVWEALKAQLKVLAATISGPNMENILLGFKYITSSIQGLSDWAKNPENAGAVKKVFDGLAAAAVGLTAASLAGVILAIGPAGLVIGGIAAMIKLDWDGFQKRLKSTTDEIERIRLMFEQLGAWLEPWAEKLGLTSDATKKFIADDPLTAFATYLADAHKGRLEELKNIFTAGANLLGLEIQAWPSRWSVWILELGKKLDELIKKVFKGPLDWLNKGHEEHSSLMGGSSSGSLYGGAGNDNLSSMGGFGGSAVRALAVGEGTGVGHTASQSERAAHIRAYAASIGMDPETALRVAQSEGFYGYVGDRDKGGAFGDYQLLARGGLGTKALAAGINIRDPNTWREQHKFALDYAKKHGWGSWYGARKVGIGNWQGINALGGVAGSRVGAGKGKLSGLDSDFAARVAALQAEYPNLGITSGFRSHAEQAALYRSKPGLAARPGHSKHELGLAADLNWGGRDLWGGLGPEGHAKLRESAAKHGLHFPMMTRQRGRKWEPWHIERMPGAAPTVGPPPKQTAPPHVLEVKLDKKKVGRIIMAEGAARARHPTSAGGPDTYGYQHGPGTPLRDVA